MEDNGDKDQYCDLIGLLPQFFEDNRRNFIRNLKQRYLELEPESLIVFEGGRLLPFYSSDCFYYFFDQESNFYYLTGVREPNMRLVIDTATEEATLFYEPEPDDYKIWMRVPSREEIQLKSNLPTKLLADFDSFIQSRSTAALYQLGGSNQYSTLKVFAPQLKFEKPYEALQCKVTPSEAIYNILCETRLVKTANELQLIQFITKISNEALMELIRAVKPGLFEHDLENVYLTYLRTRYHIRFMSFNCSCASGKNSAYIKYEKNNSIIEDGELFVAHLGIRFCGYASDASITLPVNGKFTDKQKEVYNVVLKANSEVVQSLQIKKCSIQEMNQIAHGVILQGLKELGVIKAEADVNEMIAKGLGKIFMPHSIGHSLGLDAHDVGLSETKPIQSCTVLTIEPGIYFNGILLDQALNNPLLFNYLNINCVNSYRGFGGIRISDTVVVNDTKVISYQAGIPKSIQDIELLMQSNK